MTPAQAGPPQTSHAAGIGCLLAWISTLDHLTAGAIQYRPRSLATAARVRRVHVETPCQVHQPAIR